MADSRKTKAALIEENRRLRERIAELEGPRGDDDNPHARATRGLFRRLVDASPDSVFVKDKDRRYTFVNRTMEEVLGHPASEILGKTPEDLFDPASARTIAEVDQKCLAGETADSVRTVSVGDTAKTFHTLQLPIRDDSGKVVGVCGFVRDVTERVAAERIARLSQYSVDHAAISVFRIDSHGRFQFVNEAACAALGYSRDELLRLSVVDIDVFLAPETYRAQWESLKQKGSGILESVHRRKDGSTFPVEISANYIVFDGEEFNFAYAQDISDRKHAEAELRAARDELERRVEERTAALAASEEKFRLLAEKSHDVIWTRDLKMNLTYVSPSVMELRGYTPAEAMEQSIDENMTPESRERVAAMVAEEFALEAQGKADPGRSRIVEVEMRRKDGSTVWCEVSAGILRDDEGDSIGILGISRDIGERKKHEQALRESEERFRTLVENSPDIIMTLDDQGLIRYVNKVGPGYTIEQIAGSEAAALLTPRSVERHNAALAQARKTGAVQQYEVTSTNGRIHSARMAPLHDTGDEPLFILIVTDITDRVQAEHDLRESEERYRALVENSPDFILTLDPKGVIRYVNRPGPNFGSDRLVGSDVRSFLDPAAADRFERAFAGLLVDGKTREIEVTGLTGLSYTVRIAPIMEDGQVRYVVCIATDISERKRAAEDTARLEEQLRQAQKMQAIGQLAGGVAHDFNNILMGVVGGVSLIKRKIAEDSPLYDKVEAIEHSAEQAVLLTNQLLGFARGGKYQPVSVDLAEIAEQGIAFLPSSLKQRVRVETEFGVGLDPVEADRTQVLQVIANLCINANEAMDGVGRIVIETAAADRQDMPEILKGTGRDYNVLSVWDSGPGIDPELREKIFDPFYTSKDYGRGLGLAAVWGIAANHGGTVVCRESPDGGAWFDVYLPRANGPAENEPAAKPGEDAGRPTGRGVALVVDDDRTSREMAASMLESIGYRTLVADSGARAVEIFDANANDIEIALLDVIMPRMGGEETLRRLRERRPEFKALFMSGFTEDLALHDDTETTNTGFVRKPFDVQTLGKAMGRLLAGA